jgi:hypothetical protein
MAANVALNDSGRVRQGQRSAARYTSVSAFICHSLDNLDIRVVISEVFTVIKQNICRFLGRSAVLVENKTIMKVSVFCVVALCSLVEVYRRFR